MRPRSHFLVDRCDQLYDSCARAALSSSGPEIDMTKPSRRNDQRNFFAELKRRNVYKVGMLTSSRLALSQGIAQSSSLRHSELDHSLIVLLISSVWPIALVLSWMFEITPKESNVLRSRCVGHIHAHTGSTLLS